MNKREAIQLYHAMTHQKEFEYRAANGILDFLGVPAQINYISLNYSKSGYDGESCSKVAKLLREMADAIESSEDNV